MQNEDVWVVVPTFNEATVVRTVIEQLRRHFPNVVGVDDASTDGSAEEILKAKARLVRHPVNMGAGGALQTGIDFALLDPGARLFVTFDADGQHRVDDAVAMVEHMRHHDLAVLLGSRFLGATNNMKPSRKALLLAARTFERVSTGIALTDAHNGLRVFTREFAAILKMRMADMAWASEFLDRMAESGLPYGEFPVTVDYTQYSQSKGQHSINSVNIGVDILLNRILRGHR